MGMNELPVVMDLPGEIAILLVRGLENHLLRLSGKLLLRCAKPTLEPFIRLCRARYTLPNDPFPISFPIV
jgi:hypothetical protein